MKNIKIAASLICANPINLEKEVKMKCVFISKFDSWKNIEISNNNISPRREIICYKKK